MERVMKADLDLKYWQRAIRLCQERMMEQSEMLTTVQKHNTTLIAAIRDALHELRMSDDGYAGRASRAELALSMALDAIGEED
jgi:hypothetical protein